MLALTGPFIFLLICYAIGTLFPQVLNGDRENYFLDALQNIFFGSLFAALIYAIIVTGFKTILIAAIPLLTILIANRKKEHSANRQAKIIKGPAYSIAIMLLTLIVQVYSYEYFNPNIVSIGFSDHAYYAHAANMMNKLGTEGLNYDFTNHSLMRMPYHYYDLWLVAFIQKLFSCSILDAYIYIFTPFALTIAFLSVAAVAYEISKKSVVLIVPLSLLLLFSEFFPLPLKMNVFNLYLFKFPKSFVSFAVFALFICYYRRDKIKESFTILLLLPILNIVAAPTVFTTVFISGCYYYSIKKKEGLYAAMMSIAVAAMILLFYVLTSNAKGQHSIDISTITDARAVTIIAVTVVLCIFLFLFRKKIYLIEFPEKKIIMISLLIVATGIFYFMLLRDKNSFQVLGFPVKSVMAILAVTAIVYAVNKVKKGAAKYSIYAVLVILLFYNFNRITKRLNGGIQKVSKTFLKTTAEEIPEYANISFVYNKTTIKRQWSYEPHLCSKLFFPYAMNKNVNMVCLSLPDNYSVGRHINVSEKSDYETGIFYKFVQEHRKSSAPVSYYQQQFLARYNIRFIVLEKSAAIDTNDLRIKKSYTDSISKATLLIL